MTSFQNARESRAILLACVGLLFSACGSSVVVHPGTDDGGSGDLPDAGPPPPLLNLKPAGLGDVHVTVYDGTTDDLLTAGLGKAGLAGPAPTFADPANPTAAELRRLTLYNNYRALVDISANGGFGTLYGPNLDAHGQPAATDKISGREYLSFSDDGSGLQNVVLMVQVPDTFDPETPCIVTGTSSGSRGVYGAIATSGEWGLKRGCAVAYTDKGTGIGLHDLETNTVNLLDGTRAPAPTASSASHFTAELSASELADFNAATPHRMAYKHTHSRQHPEKDWGRNTLGAIEFAFYVLNEQFAATDSTSGLKLLEIMPENTVVIASSVSNGGGGALAAAELDEKGLIDAVVASEPQAQVSPGSDLEIREGGVVVEGHSKSLPDYVTFANLYQLCASLAPAASPAPVPAGPAALATERCRALKDKGLLASASLEDQAEEALAKLIAYGWSAEGNVLQAVHTGAVNATAIGYVTSYGRFSVKDNLCGFSYAATNGSGDPVAAGGPALAAISATASGLPTAGNINIVYNDSVGGPKAINAATSPSTGLKDRALDGDLCLRSLVTGVDPVTGAALSGDALAKSNRVRAGIAEVRRTGNLAGRPTIIVQGRSDTFTPINHTGRAYYATNQVAEGSASRLRLYEVLNAHHLDAFNGLPGYDTRLIPLQRYFVQALDLMYAHLTDNAPLPPSQLVRTVPRGGTAGSAPAITT
ncbi:MAG: 3-hydroxybutyrate oligomer hydrolase family protein, partial [Myxococcaceae bacterium]